MFISDSGMWEAFSAFARNLGVLGEWRREEIKGVLRFAFHYEKTLVGIAALKQPNETYKKRVFEKAGVPKESNNYNLEIG